MSGKAAQLRVRRIEPGKAAITFEPSGTIKLNGQHLDCAWRLQPPSDRSSNGTTLLTKNSDLFVATINFCQRGTLTVHCQDSEQQVEI